MRDLFGIKIEYENSKYEFVNGVLVTIWSLTITRICLQLKKDDLRKN